MTTEVVRLTPWELLDAATVGVRRYCRGLTLPNRHGLRKTTLEWQYDIVGAIGEAVVAKHFNRYWSGLVGDPWRLVNSDVGKSLHVRTSAPGRRLIVHKTDPDDGIFILVTGIDLEWTLEGWLVGWEAKQDQWWDVRTGRPAFFVPRESLHPISKLAI